MKKLIFLFFLSLSLMSCSIHKIGDCTMLSIRNVNDKMDYCLKKSYAGDTKKEIRKNRSKTIDEAADKLIRTVPGGEFLRNVRIFRIDGFKKRKYAVTGDVWGYCSEDASHKGFSVGDAVIWKEGAVFQRGTIEAIKNGDKAIVITGDGNYRTIDFRRLSKASDSPN